jgi:hypothetical protein
MDQPSDASALEKRDVLRERIEQLKSWLKENGQGCDVDQSHLVESSRECAYWHCGYLAALEDVLALLSDEIDSLH